MKKTISLLITLVLLLSLLTCCGSTASNSNSEAKTESTTASPAAAGSTNENAAEAAQADTSAAEEVEEVEVRKIVAATTGGPRPLVYTNEAEELDGHNVKLLEAAFALLPQYELETIRVSDLGSILTGVNSGIYQLGFNNLAKNAEREKLVQYTDPIMVNDYLVLINKDLHIEFDGLESLAGLTVYGNAGNDKTTLIEDWNEEHPDQQININYNSGDIVTNLQDLEAGRVDFYIIDAPLFYGYYQNEYNIDVDI